jgi:8-oxo-dGTP pyrophosphatase MutT (NUDIX family)
VSNESLEGTSNTGAWETPLTDRAQPLPSPAVTPDTTVRLAAKVLVITPDASVLLFRGGDPGRPTSGTWWFPPGGGVEPGESIEAAARREFGEETGVVLDDLGPVVHRRIAEFEFNGQTIVGDEHYFAVHAARFEVNMDGWTELERAIMEEHRWWTLAELRDSADTIYPEDLARLVTVHALAPACPPVSVSRRIGVPASSVFGLLSDPTRHIDLDGSGMVRGAVTDGPVTAVDDVFAMRMHFPALGDYEMENHVVAFERDRRIGWEPVAGRGHPEQGEPARGHRWSYELLPDGPDATIVTETYDCSRVPEAARSSVAGGRLWMDAMLATLDRLDRLCTSR